MAQKRLARGVKLNSAEATALIASQVLEFIRDGRSVSELMDLGRQFLGKKQVIAGVASMLVEIQVEGTFPDGTKLVTVHDPISQENGDMKVVGCAFAAVLRKGYVRIHFLSTEENAAKV